MSTQSSNQNKFTLNYFQRKQHYKPNNIINNNNVVSILPVEIWIHIIQYLDRPSHLILSQTFSFFKQIVRNEKFIWQSLKIDFENFEYRYSKNKLSKSNLLVSSQSRISSTSPLFNLRSCINTRTNPFNNLTSLLSDVSIWIKELEIRINNKAKELVPRSTSFINISFPRLTFLKVTGPYILSKVFLDSIFGNQKLNFMQLRSLNLSYVKEVEYKALDLLIKNCNDLHSVSLERKIVLDDFLLLSLVSHHPNIRELELSSIKILTTNGWSFLNELKSLEHLKLDYCDVDDTIIEIISPTLNNLTSLSIQANPWLTPTGQIRLLFHLKSINELNISKNTMSFESITSLVRYCCSPKLKCLSIADCRSEFTDDVLTSIAQNAPNLIHLDLSITSTFSNEGIQSVLKHCEQLQSIRLDFCRQLTDTCIYMLTKYIVEHHYQLKYLSLMGCKGFSRKAIKFMTKKVNSIVYPGSRYKLHSRRCNSAVDAYHYSSGPIIIEHEFVRHEKINSFRSEWEISNEFCSII